MYTSSIVTALTLNLPAAGPLPVKAENSEKQVENRPDALEAANTEFRSAMEGRGGSYSRARSLYQTFLANPGGATVGQRAEAMFFYARCFQEERLVAGARHAFHALLRDRDFAATDFGLQAQFCLGQISHRSGGYSIAREELETFLTQFEARRPAPTALAPLANSARALLADCYARESVHQTGDERSRSATEALRLYQAVLAVRPPVDRELADFAIRGIAYLADSSARDACAATSSDERTRLWTKSLEALQVLQRDHASNPLAASMIRSIAGRAYDHALGTTDSSRWQRARTLFTQVHALGEASPHRNDALYYLGWCEVRLGNFSGARTHFVAFSERASTDSRIFETEELAAICQAEISFRQAADTTDRDQKITHLRAAVTALAGINNPSHAPATRSLCTRVARELFPLLTPSAPDNAFHLTHTAVRTVLGNDDYSNLLYNSGIRLLRPSTGSPSEANRTQGLALLRRVVTDHSTTRAGRLAALDVARADGNWANMADAALALRNSLPAPSRDMSAADRQMWIYATSQRAFAQVLQGRGADATATLTSALTTMEKAFADTIFTASRQQLLGGTWGSILNHGRAIVAREVARPCALTMSEQTQAANCFTYLIDSPQTLGQVVRAEAHLGRGRLYHHLGRIQDARNTYDTILLRFTGDTFQSVRTRATQAASGLPAKE